MGGKNKVTDNIEDIAETATNSVVRSSGSLFSRSKYTITDTKNVALNTISSIKQITAVFEILKFPFKPSLCKSLV